MNLKRFLHKKLEQRLAQPLLEQIQQETPELADINFLTYKDVLDRVEEKLDAYLEDFDQKEEQLFNRDSSSVARSNGHPKDDDETLEGLGDKWQIARNFKAFKHALENTYPEGEVPKIDRMRDLSKGMFAMQTTLRMLIEAGEQSPLCTALNEISKEYEQMRGKEK